jgi:superfamily I DNA/RNA helicase
MGSCDGKSKKKKGGGMVFWDGAFERAKRGLDLQAVEVFPLPGNTLPDFLLASPEIGLVAVGLLVIPRTEELELVEEDYIRDLKRRTRRLKSSLSIPEGTGVRIKVWKVRDPVLTSDPGKELFDAGWVADMATVQIEPSLLQQVRESFGQPRVFESKRRVIIEDKNLQNRVLERFRLDEQQNSLASDLTGSKLFISGPPGSGKTLVIFARIRYLLEANPGSRILLVSFNKALAASFREVFKNRKNVTVLHFHALASEFGVRFPSSSTENQSLKDFLRAKNASPGAVYDLVAVDEAQDFKVGWLKWLSHLVKPNGAGLLMAGDLAQSLYNGAEGSSLRLIDSELTVVHLEKPYRSTNQILDVIGALDESFSIHERSEAQDGEPVQLVWAQTKSEIGKAIAFIVGELLNAHPDYEYRDMAVLVPNYFWLQGEDGIARQLEGHGLPVDATWRTRGDLLSIGENMIRLMTIHSSKGLEFPIVFLVGLESIKGDISNNELDTDLDPEAAISRAKLNLVGPSRARDLLYIFYTQSNAYLRRLKESRAPIQESVYPDDYVGS